MARMQNEKKPLCRVGSTAMVLIRGAFPLRGEWVPPQEGAWDCIKKFIVVFAGQGLASTQRYPLTKMGLGWWWNLQKWYEKSCNVRFF